MRDGGRGGEPKSAPLHAARATLRLGRVAARRGFRKRPPCRGGTRHRRKRRNQPGRVDWTASGSRRAARPGSGSATAG